MAVIFFPGVKTELVNLPLMLRRRAHTHTHNMFTVSVINMTKKLLNEANNIVGNIAPGDTLAYDQG